MFESIDEKKVMALYMIAHAIHFALHISKGGKYD